MKYYIRFNFVIIFSLATFATQQGHAMQLEACATDLMSLSEKNSTLINAIQAKDINKTNTLIDAGADVNAFMLFETPLIAAAKADNVEAIKTLVKEGVDVNESYIPRGRHNEYSGMTPLAYAAEYNNISAINALLEEGADPNIPDTIRGWIPLIHAIRNLNLNAIEALSDAGSNLNSIDKKRLDPSNTCC